MEKPERETMTIVVPVYNRPRLIVRCLESLKAQTWRPLRVIVVDNGSSDTTPEVVRQWKEANSGSYFVVDLLFDKRKGAAYARQTGLEQTFTDKVMFYDSDDCLRPHSVALIMKAWEKIPDADVVAFPMLRHYGGKTQQTHSAKGNLLERHLVHAILQTEGFAVKSDFLKAVGGWRGEFPNWNDFETGTRILLSSPKVISISKPLSDVFPQEESITGTSYSEKVGKWELSLDGIEKTIRESRRADMERLLNIINYRRAILAADYAKEGRQDLAKPLYRNALRKTPIQKRPLIRFAYHWTRLHMRGAFMLIGRLL